MAAASFYGLQELGKGKLPMNTSDELITELHKGKAPQSDTRYSNADKQYLVPTGVGTKHIPVEGCGLCILLLVPLY